MLNPCRVTKGLWIGALLWLACGRQESDIGKLLIAEPPVVRAPADNPASDAKVLLGRHLFYDRRLSVNGERACSTCHEQQKGFTDGFPRAIGATRELHRYNSPTLTNVAHRRALSWADPEAIDLEDQLLIPLLGQHPVEMGMGGMENVLLQRLATQPRYSMLFAAAFPEHTGPNTIRQVAQALATFERSLISRNSAFDRYLAGQASALTPLAQQGLQLFFGGSGCSKCHHGTDLDRPASEANVGLEPMYSNIGLYNLDQEGAYPQGAQGLIETSGQAHDMGKFRTPSLRNVEATGPYFHDGSTETLIEAIRIHLEGGRNVVAGPRSGDGRNSPHRDPLLTPRHASEQDIRALEAFLLSLMDDGFLNDPALADPWPTPMPPSESIHK